MTMSLTQDDLMAIKALIDSSIDERVPAIINDRVPAIINDRVPAIINDRVPAIINEHVPAIVREIVKPMLEEAIDEVKQHTAAGFGELHDKFEALSAEMRTMHATVQRIEQVQQAEVERVDAQSTMIATMRKTLRAV